jgi:hypothetical protein
VLTVGALEYGLNELGGQAMMFDVVVFNERGQYLYGLELQIDIRVGGIVCDIAEYGDEYW